MLSNKKYVFFAILLTLAVGLAGCGNIQNTGDSSQEDDVSVVTARGFYSPEDYDFSVADEGSAGAEEEFFATDEEYAAGEDVYSVAEQAPDDGYAYRTLTDTQKAVYDVIVQTIADRTEQASIPTTDIGDMEQAYLAVRCDHCEFFWVGQLGYVVYTRGDDVVGIDIEPQYTMTADEQSDIQRRIDAEADRMLEGAPADGSDFEKALYVFETLINEVDYDLNAEDGQTIISAFLGHATVCQGYSYATQYLLDRLGIQCATVTGTAGGEPHAWNLVLLDGDYYYIDTTWGNSQYIDQYDSDVGDIIPYKFIDYDYFGVTTQMMSVTHQPDDTIELPLCEAEADNYYVHEGLYIDTWDEERIGEIIRRGYEDGESLVRIRFADSDIYDWAVQYFLRDGGVFDYCAGLQSIQYLENPDTEVMVVVF